jgi:hypothetical protein
MGRGVVIHDLDQVTRSPVSLTRGSDGSIHSSSEDLRQSRHNLGFDQVNRQRGPSPRRPVELRLKTSLFLRRQQDDWPSIASPSPLAAAEHHHFFRNHAKKTKRHTQPTPRMSDYSRQEIASRILHALGFEKRSSTDPQNSDGKIDSTLLGTKALRLSNEIFVGGNEGIGGLIQECMNDIEILYFPEDSVVVLARRLFSFSTFRHLSH